MRSWNPETGKLEDVFQFDAQLPKDQEAKGNMRVKFDGKNTVQEIGIDYDVETHVAPDNTISNIVMGVGAVVLLAGVGLSIFKPLYAMSIGLPLMGLGLVITAFGRVMQTDYFLYASIGLLGIFLAILGYLGYVIVKKTVLGGKLVKGIDKAKKKNPEAAKAVTSELDLSPSEEAEVAQLIKS